ncbi:hypothetical protein M378DRAFT_163410 [Amanita muscaria Koide BX008]|uniref:Uncharacterized protein n=1 Tax=Amanita muscaria (strain Koide BX008) TaxID=946122 RepID=A0A0C2TC28_AMAMK|nr:hypothetical protein M378DRAFT_163410 [Amanita muscaria Koide BX008]
MPVYPVAQTSSLTSRKKSMTRRRAHILERAQAQLAGPACQLTTNQNSRRVSQTTDEISPSYQTESESQSESSMSPRTGGSDRGSATSNQEDMVDSNLSKHSPERHQKHTSKKPHSRAWYEFDLAVLVALVSPIGHWLTGGDYIKNLLLIILVIYYLHQIIEVPWTIYEKARLYRPLPPSPPSTVEEKYQLIAASELRKIELFFLALTAISPFIGAAFLRYATKVTFGPEAVSWFNVILFILATGMRPWAHIVERLKQRTSDLHDVIQYAAPAPNASAEMVNRLDELMKKVTKLEKNTHRIEVKTVQLREDVYHDIDEIMEKLDGIARRHEKKHAKHESRVRDMEDTLKTIKHDQPKPRLHVFRFFPISLLRYIVPSWLYLPPYRMFVYVLYPSTSSTPHSHSPATSPLSKVAQDEAYPLLARSTQITSALLSRIGYIATLPLRTVVRMVLRRY